MRIYIIIKKVCKKCLFKNIYRGNGNGNLSDIYWQRVPFFRSCVLKHYLNHFTLYFR